MVPLAPPVPTHTVPKPPLHPRPTDGGEKNHGRERYGDARDVYEVAEGIVRGRLPQGLRVLHDRDEHRASCRTYPCVHRGGSRGLNARS
jgi:hypothetical protein